MAEAFQFEKPALRVKLKGMGLSDVQLEEIMSVFDQRSRHIDVLSFVLAVERFGISRDALYRFLKEVGLDDPTLINVFSRADLKKAGLDESKIQEVALSD